MNDPREMIECERCDGTGLIQGSCPYSGDIDPDCESCAGMCETTTCPDCDGKGELTQSEYNEIIYDKEHYEN